MKDNAAVEQSCERQWWTIARLYTRIFKWTGTAYANGGVELGHESSESRAIC